MGHPRRQSTRRHPTTTNFIMFVNKVLCLFERVETFVFVSRHTVSVKTTLTPCQVNVRKQPSGNCIERITRFLGHRTARFGRHWKKNVVARGFYKKKDYPQGNCVIFVKFSMVKHIIAIIFKVTPRVLALLTIQNRARCSLVYLLHNVNGLHFSCLLI